MRFISSWILWANPPWSQIPRLLRWIEMHQIHHILLCLPHWPGARWFPHLKQLTLKWLLLPERPLYATLSGHFLKAPRWRTLIALCSASTGVPQPAARWPTCECSAGPLTQWPPAPSVTELPSDIYSEYYKNASASSAGRLTASRT